MKIIDNLLIIAAAFSLFTLSLVFSNHFFAGINKLIPELFSGRASIHLSSTFHLLVASIITGFLLVRYAPRPMLSALIVVLIINVESYWLLHKSHSFNEVMNYYLAHKSQWFILLKALLILPLMTHIIGLFVTTDRPENAAEKSAVQP